MVRLTVTMKAILASGVLALFALTVAGAPYQEGEQPKYLNRQQIEEFLRERRSQYSPQYVSPCAAASAMHLPASSVPVPTFAAPPYQGYAVQHYAYPVPHYRSAEEHAESELLGFSDMDRMQEHVPMARLGGYATAPVAAMGSALSTVGGQVLTQATSGTALGVFPNANVGGCGVPLLFSCSPTIVPGHIVDSQGHAGSAGVSAGVSAGGSDSYRLVDEPAHHNTNDQHDALHTHEHMNLSPVHEPSHAVHQ